MHSFPVQSKLKNVSKQATYALNVLGLPYSRKPDMKINNEIPNAIEDIKYVDQNPTSFSKKVLGIRDSAPTFTHLRCFRIADKGY